MYILDIWIRLFSYFIHVCLLCLPGWLIVWQAALKISLPPFVPKSLTFLGMYVNAKRLRLQVCQKKEINVGRGYSALRTNEENFKGNKMTNMMSQWLWLIFFLLFF